MVNSDRVIATFLDLCRINSPARHERPVAEYLRARLERLGLQCLQDRAGEATGGDTGNLIATVPANVSGARPIFFAAHMDTVEPNPDVQIVTEGREIRSDGNSILGADDRAGIAPLLEALEAIVEQGMPHGEVQAVFTVCEEVGLLGAKALERDLVHAAFGFVLDSGPPVGSIVIRAPWQDSMTVTITGKPAHAGAEPEKGVSAIQVAARAIDRMKLGRVDPETTANIGTIHGGEATNIVCPRVVLEAEARSRDSAKLQAQVSHMIASLEQAAAYYGAQVSVAVEPQYEGYSFRETDPVVALAAAGIGRIGLPVVYKAVGGGSDANVFNAKGLPTCVLGTAMKNVHTHAECASMDDLIQIAELVVAIVQEATR